MAMKPMTEEFRGVPPDVRPVLDQLIRSLNRLTVLEQEQVLELLVVRHVVRRAYPEQGKIIDVLGDMLANIAATIRTSLEESRARQS
jgi:hypothetical protein